MESSATKLAEPIAPADDVLRRAGVTVNTTNGVTRIDVPPVPSIKYLRTHVIWLVILGTLVLFMSIGSIGTPQMIPGAIEYALITALVAAHFAYRLRRHLLFEIDDGAVILLNVYGGKPKRDRSWPRRDITEAKIIATGRLWLRAQHRQVAEIYLTPWRNVNEAIAAELRTAITVDHPHPATDSSELWYASSSIADQELSSNRKRTYLIISMVLSALGFASLLVGAFGLSMIFFLGAAAPAGLALGTQENKMYL